MPLIVTNLGSEMIFILSQRLKAQQISQEKCIKVLDDVVSAWFDQQFIEELFKPQHVYSMLSTRQIFDRLAHSSIMKLNTERCVHSDFNDFKLVLWYNSYRAKFAITWLIGFGKTNI